MAADLDSGSSENMTRLLSDEHNHNHPSCTSSNIHLRAGGSTETKDMDELNSESVTDSALPIDDVIATVKNIQKDPLAFDLHLCLISAACKSYRRESTMKPLPKLYCKPTSANAHSGNCVSQSTESSNDGGSKLDASQVLTILESLPPLTTIMKSPSCLSQTQSLFLNWVLGLGARVSTCKLSSVPRSVGLTEPLPDFIFRVDYSQNQEQVFKKRSEGKGTFYAMHGSSLENFHSILQFGLLGNLSKEGLFGQGVYLSTEQSVSLNHSKTSHAWFRSKIGVSLSCIAVCQVIDEPGSVQCGSAVVASTLHSGESSSSLSSEPSLQLDPNKSGSGGGKSTQLNTRFSNRTGSGGDGRSLLPSSYVLVKNRELIQVKYLLVYRTSRPRFQRRVMTVYDEYRTHILLTSAFIILFAIYYYLCKLFAYHSDDFDQQQYLQTEYVHQNIII